MAESAVIQMANLLRWPVLASACIDTAAPVSIVPLEVCARFSLRVRAAEAVELSLAGGLCLDIPINTFVVENHRTIARLGPDEWLVLAPDVVGEKLVRALDALLIGCHASLVDIGHRNVGIAVRGVRAREVLNGGCPLDLHDDAFPAFSATRTVLGKAEIVLLRLGGACAYRVECWRSFSPYVHALLNEVAREFTQLTTDAR